MNIREHGILLGGKKKANFKSQCSLQGAFQFGFSVSGHEFTLGLWSLLEPPWALNFTVQALKPLVPRGATQWLHVCHQREVHDDWCLIYWENPSVLWLFLKEILCYQTDESIENTVVDHIFDLISQYVFSKHLLFPGHVHFTDYEIVS